MRIMFVYFIAEDAGSAQDVHNYIRAAEELGHEIVLYGRPGALPSFKFSLGYRIGRRGLLHLRVDDRTALWRPDRLGRVW